MKTPITYYGGKQRLAETICSLMPSHKVYVEPFFGGGAVFFYKHHPQHVVEVINDINDNIVNFYRVLQNEYGFQRLQAKIQDTLFSEAIFLYAKAIWNKYQPADDIDRAWATWVVTNYAFNGTPDGSWKWDMGTAGSHSGVVAAHKRNNFTISLFKRMEHVQICCRDAVDVIKQRDSLDTFFYIDPPYIGCDMKHYRGYTDEDYEKLLQTLKHIKGKFILSSYMNDILYQYIAMEGWRFDEFEMNASATNLHRSRTKNNNNGRKVEILVMNYIPKEDRKLFY